MPTCPHNTSPPILLALMAVSLVLLWVDVPAVHAQQAQASIDRDTLHTGDRITYQVRITGVEGYDEVVYPDSAAFAPDFFIRQMKADRDQWGDTLTYELHFFGVDTQAVPELEAGLVRGSDTLLLSIPEVPFAYSSRVDDPEANMRPLKPIFPFFRSWWPFLLLGLVLALVAAWLMYRYRRKIIPEEQPVNRPVVRVEPFRNPIDDLRQELDRIRYAYGEPHRLPKQFYSELGDAFRAYFERTYSFPALESTTLEVVRELRANRADEEMIELLSDILEEADLVKFAKYQPNEANCKHVMEQARQLFARISDSDRYRIAVLRKKHEEEQKAKQSEESEYDLG